MLVWELQRQDAEDERHGQLTYQLGGLVQAEVALFEQLDEVIGKTQTAQAHGEEVDQKTGGAKTTVTGHAGINSYHEVGHGDGQQNRQSAHGGGAALAQVQLRSVLADFLPLAYTGKVAHQHGSGKDRDEEAEDARDNDLSHC